MRFRNTFSALSFLLAFAFTETQAGSVAQSPAVRHALENFDHWDADRDEKLSVAELDAAIASPATKGENAAAAVALLRIARSKQNPVSSFTRESVSSLAPALRFIDARDEEEAPETAHDSRGNLDRYYDSALRKIVSSPRELFVGPPSLDSFRQGRLGTCFSLAPLTALTLAAPDDLVSRFTVAPDGASVTVTFGLGHAITVPALTDGEVALGTDTGGNGLWAATYEKAGGELRRTAKNAADTPYAIATRGGSAGSMLSTLTGRAIRRFSCKAWLPGSDTPADELAKKLDELRALLRAATEEKRLMTAGTSSKTRKVPSLSRNHAYAVLAYDPATDLVTIRDPHGQDFTPRGEPGLDNGYVVRRGVFQIPAPDVVRVMSGFAFQLDTPAKTKGYPSSDPTLPTDPAEPVADPAS